MKRTLLSTIAWSAIMAGAGLAIGADAPAETVRGGEYEAPSVPRRDLSPADDTSGWRCKSEDNICGLREKKQLSNPALVDWDALMDATSEMKEMKKKGIDPMSPEGIRLRQKAKERVTNACTAEMNDKGFCSVWKDISHKDNRTIDDITAAVEARL